MDEFLCFLFKFGYSSTISTRNKHCRCAKQSKEAIFRRGQKCRRAAAFAAYVRISTIEVKQRREMMDSLDFQLPPESHSGAPESIASSSMHPALTGNTWTSSGAAHMKENESRQVATVSFKEIDQNVRNFRKFSPRLDRLNFRFFLHGTVEHALISL